MIALDYAIAPPAILVSGRLLPALTPLAARGKIGRGRVKRLVDERKRHQDQNASSVMTALAQKLINANAAVIKPPRNSTQSSADRLGCRRRS